jgi:hypothetical protein
MTDPDIVTELRYLSYRLKTVTGQMAMRKAADEIERLRAERDELRRLVCRADAERRGQAAQASGMSDWFYSPKQIAAEYGWDCFREET